MIKYEIKNAYGNFFGIFFGLVFPIVMTIVLKAVILKDIPEIAHDAVNTKLFVMNAMMSPLALVFIGFAVLFSQEIEKNIDTRIALFGISEKEQLRAKFSAQAVVVIMSLGIYTAIIAPYLGLKLPSLWAGIVTLVAFTLLTFILFVLAYSIALIARKFSITYGVTMTLYFAIMIFSGMMGVQFNDLPEAMKVVAKLLPTTYIVNDIPKLWNLDSYNLASMIQSFIGFAAVTGIVYLWAMKKKRRQIG